MNIKAMIFDLYGTLVDNFSISAYYNNLAGIAGILKIPPKELQQFWKDIYAKRVLGSCKSPEDCIALACEHFAVSVDVSNIQQAENLRWDFVRASLQPRNDALSTLDAIKSFGMKIALLSDCSTEIPRIWNETAFAGIFDATTFSCTEFVKKPDRRIYFRTADKLGIEPNECIYVGDGGSFELTGAERVGMHPIRIRAPYETEDTMRVEEDPWTGTTISKLSELVLHFKKLVVA